MSNIRFVSDSTINLSDQVVEDWGLSIAPVYVLFGNESMKDSGEQSVAEFYRRLAAADELPTSSQPTPADIAAIYRRLAREGATDIISIHVTARSSGTCNSAELAKGMLADEDVDIHVVDSESTSLHMAFMLREAMDVAEAGGSAADALAAIDHVKANSDMFFTVTRVEHLERSGRTHGAEQAIQATVKVQPVITIAEGVPKAIEQVRTRRAGFNRVIALMQEASGGKPIRRLGIVHGNVLHFAEQLADMAADAFSFPREQIMIGDFGPGLTVHFGPGLLGITAQRA